MNVATTDNRTGRRIIAAINPIVGGAGGGPQGDGTDGSGGDTTNGQDGTGSGNQTAPGVVAPIDTTDNQITVIGDGNTQRDPESNQGEEDTDGVFVGDQGKQFVVVEALSLGEPFRHPAGLVG